MVDTKLPPAPGARHAARVGGRPWWGEPHLVLAGLSDELGPVLCVEATLGGSLQAVLYSYRVAGGKRKPATFVFRDEQAVLEKLADASLNTIALVRDHHAFALIRQ